MKTDSLKHALLLIVINENLPFQLIESTALRNLVELLNPEAVKLLVQTDAIADNVMRIFFLYMLM